MKRLLLLTLACLPITAAEAATTLYNFDVTRNRGGVVFNASTDDSNIIWNTAAPSGSSAMTWNVADTGTAPLSDTTVAISNLLSSTGAASDLGISIGLVNTDGYSDQPPRDGVWTGYMTTAAANGAGPTITLSGFTEGDTINLVLYTGNARFGGANSGDFTFGGVTKSYAETLATSAMPLTEGVTYLRFDGLVADSGGEITGTFGLGSTGSLANLAGIQFEVIPEPSATLLGGLGILCLLRRRRG
jgi:hypothetical protein